MAKFIFETPQLIQKQSGTDSFLGSKLKNRSFEKIVYRCEQCLEDKTLFRVVDGNHLYILCLQCGTLFDLRRYYPLKNKGSSYKVFHLKTYHGKGMFTVFLRDKYIFVPLVNNHKYLKKLYNQVSKEQDFVSRLTYISRMIVPRVNVNKNIHFTIGNKDRAKIFLNYLILLSDKEKLDIISYVRNIYGNFFGEKPKAEFISKRNYLAIYRYNTCKAEYLQAARKEFKKNGFLD